MNLCALEEEPTCCDAPSTEVACREPCSTSSKPCSTPTTRDKLDATFNDEAWGRGGDFVWMVIFIGAIWAMSSIWLRR